MKQAVYTCTTGNYDSLKTPYKTKGWDYICYSDLPTISDGINGWEIRPIKDNGLGAIKTARERKINLIPDYDLSVWVDASIQIKCDMDLFVMNYLHSDLAIMKHMGRDCLYQEAEACMKIGKDRVAVISKQMDRYRKRGYPERTGLIASGVIIRKHTKAVDKFCKAWWNEVKKGSHRDQLSFNYVASKLPLEYNTFDFTVLYGNEMQIFRHGKNE